ncbi:lipopolysaccharide assembly protein LapA domain-containing protein [Niveispirillum sp. BGYR6]|uniref:lipopolysaccharide assembly protein LapA domain-containing protein n=1 Tax=Niveispirillum sp. BGYR6 TaxID=2971249 RepID=UPI0022B9A350|nr:lipopolysaccharide assembly protein LapA domain-containing protein [Niveispirillum sp. BGYR6]
MRYLSWIVTLPLAVIAISFAISNLTPVQLSLWPLPFFVEAPAFALVLVTLVLGFLLGGLTVWVGQHGHRKAERKHQSRADKLQKELDLLRAEKAAGTADTPIGQTLPRV